MYRINSELLSNSRVAYLIHNCAHEGGGGLKTFPPPSVGVLNVEFALKLRIYRSLKSLICLKGIRKKFSTTLHTQFNYLTQPVTPFKSALVFDIIIFLTLLYFFNWFGTFRTQYVYSVEEVIGKILIDFYEKA